LKKPQKVNEWWHFFGEWMVNTRLPEGNSNPDNIGPELTCVSTILEKGMKISKSIVL
jgi:hypothetical protein